MTTLSPEQVGRNRNLLKQLTDLEKKLPGEQTIPHQIISTMQDGFMYIDDRALCLLALSLDSAVIQHAQSFATDSSAIVDTVVEITGLNLDELRNSIPNMGGPDV